MPSSIESVASFSIILGETFAAVGLSTLVPNTFIALTKAAKGATAAAAGTYAASLPDNARSLPGANKAVDIMLGAANSLDSMDILLPKDAKIHAEFEFQGADRMDMTVNGGLQVEAVSVRAGYSAMYESKSSNKITLDVNFATVHVGLETVLFPGKPTNVRLTPAGTAAIITWDVVSNANGYKVSWDGGRQDASGAFCIVTAPPATGFKNVTVEAYNDAGRTQSDKKDLP